ncbi:uncharacterized protein PGRI_065800 [Penicillium griseofulvum]|uniref:Tubby C-terminal-like domain-containing protein n=1 Tax=Penicillium patulum TaxID=5078 RepID=A0A135LPW1_PENPA|nr:uncharacterized protein PGRI_065800 [Penicillium griseofulvum]KXG51008.1 hypothetical protein PGRI_065800 [Penicillium griseofulvum]
MPNPKSKINPLTTPTTPIALQPTHLLSPPADLLTNTATTLTITPTQDTKPPSPTFTVHRTRTHEAPDSPDRNILLYTVFGKPWPNTNRIIYDAEGAPVLVLRRHWLSSARKWSVRLPNQNQSTDLLVASIPWATDGSGSRVGGGCRLEVRFVNALAVRSSEVTGSGSVGLAVPDEPPPYSAVSGVGEERGSGGNTDAGVVQNEKEIHPPLPDSRSRDDLARDSPSPRHTHSHSILPSYDSVRRDSPNSLRDLLDAIEPPQEPAPALPFSSSSLQNASLCPGLGLAQTNTEDVFRGSKVELRVMQLGGSSTSVMMGNQKIMHITRHNVIDYSKSKVKSRPKWEVEVSEGVDLLLAVNIVLIMAESVSQNKWR